MNRGSIVIEYDSSMNLSVAALDGRSLLIESHMQNAILKISSMVNWILIRFSLHVTRSTMHVNVCARKEMKKACIICEAAHGACPSTLFSLACSSPLDRSINQQIHFMSPGHLKSTFREKCDIPSVRLIFFSE